MIQATDKVTHEQFGEGIVSSVQQGGKLYKVLFPNYSTGLITCRLGEITNSKRNSYKRMTVSEQFEKQSSEIVEFQRYMDEMFKEMESFKSPQAEGGRIVLKLMMKKLNKLTK